MIVVVPCYFQEFLNNYILPHDHQNHVFENIVQVICGAQHHYT